MYALKDQYYVTALGNLKILLKKKEKEVGRVVEGREKGETVCVCEREIEREIERESET